MGESRRQLQGRETILGVCADEDVPMTPKPKVLFSLDELYARRLVDATGITAVQARELVQQLGLNLGSLLREAALLKKHGF